MTKITAFEKATLNWIGFAEMSTYNGHYPLTNDCETWCWADEIAAHAGCTVKQIRGTLASLVKKNLIGIVDAGTEDAAVYFTDAGYEEFKRLFPIQDWAKAELADSDRSGDYVAELNGWVKNGLTT